MVNDTNLAKYVNICKSSSKDVPEDVYSYMVEKINTKINEIIDKSCEYFKLNFLNINRNFVKKGLMTVPYGVTKRGIADQLKTEFFKLERWKDKKPEYVLLDNTFNKDNIKFYLSNLEINCLASIIHNILYETFPILKELISYLKNMNKFLKQLNLNPIWLTPGGLIIEQRYVKTKNIELVVSVLKKKKKYNY